MLASSSVNLVDRDSLKKVKEPDISEAICAELESNVGLLAILSNSTNDAVCEYEPLVTKNDEVATAVATWFESPTHA